MSTCATQQPWLETGKSIADDVDDLLAFSDPVPDPFSSNDIVGRGGVNQIETLVQVNYDLQNSLSALREEYDILYQEKSQLLVDNKSLQEKLEESSGDRYQQKVYIEQLEAELSEKRKWLASLKKDVELIKENEKLKKQIKKLKLQIKPSQSKGTSSKKRPGTFVDVERQTLVNDLRLELEEAVHSVGTKSFSFSEPDNISETISVDENILSPGVDSVPSVDANLSPNTPSLSLNDPPLAAPSAPSLGSDNANPLSMPSLLSQVSPSVGNDTQLLSVRGLSDGDDGDFMKRVYGEIKSLPQLLSPLSASSCQSPLPVHCLPSELHSPRVSHTVPVSLTSHSPSQVSPLSHSPSQVSPLSPPPLPPSQTPPLTPPPLTPPPVSPPPLPPSLTPNLSPPPLPPSQTPPVSPLPPSQTPPLSPLLPSQTPPLSPPPLPPSQTPPTSVPCASLSPQSSALSSLLSLHNRLSAPITPLPPTPSKELPTSFSSCSGPSRDLFKSSFSQMSTDSVLVSSLVLPVSSLPVPLPIRTEDCTECLCNTTMEQPEIGTVSIENSLQEVLIVGTDNVGISDGEIIDDDSDDMEWNYNYKELLSLPPLLSPLPPSPVPYLLPPSPVPVLLSPPLPPPVLLVSSALVSSSPPPALPVPHSLHLPVPSTSLPSPSVQCSGEPHASPFLSFAVSKSDPTNTLLCTETRAEQVEVSINNDDDDNLVIDLDLDENMDVIAPPSSQPLNSLLVPSLQNSTSVMVDVVAVGYTGLSSVTANDSLDIMTDIARNEERKTDEAINEEGRVPDQATGQCISPVIIQLQPPVIPHPLSLVSPLPSPVPSLPKPEWPLPVYSQLQLELPECMKCPLPLPHWLIQSMKQVQDMNEELLYKQCPPPPPGPGAKKKKKKKKAIPTHTDPTMPFQKTKKMTIPAYVCTSLELLMNGSLYLSTLIHMFTNKTVIPPAKYKLVITGAIKFLRSGYHPLFAAVRKLAQDKLGLIRKGTLDPLNSHYPPPLPTVEVMVVALMANIQSLHPQLMAEFMNQLYDEIFSERLFFHNACAMCRIYVALGRLMSGLDQIQALACEMILRSQQMGLIEAIACVWPYALSRATTGSCPPPLFVNNRLQCQGLEYQPLSFTLEVLAEEMSPPTDKSSFAAVKNAATFCKWQKISPVVRDSLTHCLIEILKSSPSVSIKLMADSKPCPSRHACTIVLALRVLSAVKGWKEWTNDVLIRDHLWPLLQQWNKKPESLREATIVCIVRLLGFVGQQGLEDSSSSSINQLQNVLLSILKKRSDSTKKVTLALQLAAVDSLIELCPPNHPNYSQVHSVLLQWINSLLVTATVSVASEYSLKVVKNSC